MNNKLYFLAFVLGLGVGIYGTADYFRAKYKARSDEEIEEVREVYREKTTDLKNKDGLQKEPVKPVTSLDKPPLSETFSDVRKAGAQMENVMKKELEKVNQIVSEARYDDPAPGPYVISPEDFGSTFEYDSVALVYYADGVLVDEDNNVVEDAESLIGDEALDHIGEYEPDSVHVRNDEKRCDYEVLLDERKWSDVSKKWSR